MEVALKSELAGATTNTRRRRGISAHVLLIPTLLLYFSFLVVPLVIIAVESFRPRLGDYTADKTWSLQSYVDLFHTQYARYFLDSLMLSATASAVAILLAYPVAHMLARTTSRLTRRLWVNLLVSSLFLEVLVRVYSISIIFGPAGLQPLIASLFEVRSSNPGYVRLQVVIGLLYFMIPMSILTLVGAIENINPKLAEAALTLGASRWRSVWVTDVALSVPAIMSTFLLTFTIAASSFTVTLVLGRGFIYFAANLIYERISELADFSSGSAVAMVMLTFSLLIVYAINWLGQKVAGKK